MRRSKPLLLREVFDPCARHRPTRSAGRLLVGVNYRPHDVAVVEGRQYDARLAFQYDLGTDRLARHLLSMCLLTIELVAIVPI